MTSILNMTSEEFYNPIRELVSTVNHGDLSSGDYEYMAELLARLRERDAAMEIVEHWKFSPAADWSAETQSFAASVLLSAMQAARRGCS